MEILKNKLKYKPKNYLLNSPNNSLFEELPFKDFILRAQSVFSPKIPKSVSNSHIGQLSPLVQNKSISTSMPKILKKIPSKSSFIYKKKLKHWEMPIKIKKTENKPEKDLESLNIEFKDYWMGNVFAKIGFIGRKLKRRQFKLPLIRKKSEPTKDFKGRNDFFIDYAEYKEPYIQKILEKKRSNS